MMLNDDALAIDKGWLLAYQFGHQSEDLFKIHISINIYIEAFPSGNTFSYSIIQFKNFQDTNLIKA